MMQAQLQDTPGAGEVENLLIIGFSETDEIIQDSSAIVLGFLPNRDPVTRDPGILEPPVANP
jgi:hypothetical protein